MTKPLRVEASSATDSAHLAAVLALGMCVGVRKGAVSPKYACDKLFRPKLLTQLRTLGVEERLCEAIAEALEIEDVGELANHGLIPLLDRLAATLLDVLNNKLTEQECWVQSSRRR
jgi:hypothetical protein